MKVTTSGRAKMLRWLFGFDAVLWGSYASIAPPLISMQIETARSKPKDEGNAWSRTWRKLQIFEALDQIENEGVIVDQEDMLDAYVAVAMALVHALNARDFRHGEMFGEHLDRLRLYNRSNRNAIITALVEDGLFALPIVPFRRDAESEAVAEGRRTLWRTRSNFSSSPTAKEVLIDVAGKWLGSQLFSWMSRDDRFPTEFLEDVALRCTELQPQEPENYYRLAAIRLMLGKTDEARKAIDTARAQDSLARRIPTIPLSVKAQMAIEELDRLSDNKRAKEAECAIISRARWHAAGTKSAVNSQKRLKRRLFTELASSKRAILRDRHCLPSTPYSSSCSA